ncbi:unnamed protein product [Closterium sp. Naga37s-1]|nr:unnamed protein product [Closterium sp. Naga37s-1]
MDGSCSPTDALQAACVSPKHPNGPLLPHSPRANTAVRPCPPAPGARSPRRNAPPECAQAHAEGGSVRSPRFAGSDVSTAAASCPPLSPSTPRTPPRNCARRHSFSTASPPIPAALSSAAGTQRTSSANPPSASASPRATRERRLSEGGREERREWGIQRAQERQAGQAEGSAGAGERHSAPPSAAPRASPRVSPRASPLASPRASPHSLSSASPPPASPPRATPPPSASPSSPRPPNSYMHSFSLPPNAQSPPVPARSSPPTQPAPTPPPPARVPPASLPYSPPAAAAPPPAQASSAAHSAPRGAERGRGPAAAVGSRARTHATGERAAATGAAAAGAAAGGAAGEAVTSTGQSGRERSTVHGGNGAEGRWLAAERSSAENSEGKGSEGAVQRGALVVADGRAGEKGGAEGEGRGVREGGEDGGGRAASEQECGGRREGAAVAVGTKGVGGEQRGNGEAVYEAVFGEGASGVGVGRVETTRATAQVACAEGERGGAAWQGQASACRDEAGWGSGGGMGGEAGVELAASHVHAHAHAAASVARLMLMRELQQLSDEDEDEEEGEDAGSEEQAKAGDGRVDGGRRTGVAAAGAGGAGEGDGIGSRAGRSRVMPRSKSMVTGPLASRAPNDTSASAAAAAAAAAAGKLGRRVVASRATSLDTFENWPAHRTRGVSGVRGADRAFRPNRATSHLHRPPTTSPSPHPPPASTTSSNLPATSATSAQVDATSASSLQRQESAAAPSSNGQQMPGPHPTQRCLQPSGTASGSMPCGRGEGEGARGPGHAVRAQSMRERVGGGRDGGEEGEGAERGDEAGLSHAAHYARSKSDKSWEGVRAAEHGAEQHWLLGPCAPIAEAPHESSPCRHAPAAAQGGACTECSMAGSGSGSERGAGGHGVLSAKGGGTAGGAGLGHGHENGHAGECISALSAETECSHGWQAKENIVLGPMGRVEERDGEGSCVMSCGACEGGTGDACTCPCTCACDDAASVSGSCSACSQGSDPRHRSTGSRSSVLSGITTDTWGTASTISAGGSSRSMCSERSGGGMGEGTGGGGGDGWFGSKAGKGGPVAVVVGAGVAGTRMSMVRALSRSVNVNLRLPSQHAPHRSHADSSTKHSHAAPNGGAADSTRASSSSRAGGERGMPALSLPQIRPSSFLFPSRSRTSPAAARSALHSCAHPSDAAPTRNLRLSSAHPPCRLFSPEDLTAATLSFHPDRLLGQGAYGPVYRGELDDGVAVAVKRMKARAAAGAAGGGGAGEQQREERRGGGGMVWEAEGEEESSGVESFEREVEVLSRVKHEHIVQLIGCCPDDCSLVYEYMAGGSLQQRLEQQALAHRVRIAHEIASALLYLHRSQPPMIHRDLKPDNILLSAHDCSKIADVGIACALANPFATSVKTHRVRGTVGFIAPEAIASFELSPRSDVYSLGIVLLMLLTGFTSSRSVHDILAQATPPGRPRDVEVAVALFTARLDKRAGRWDAGLARRVVRVGVRCVERCAEMRPDLEEEVEPELEEVEREAVRQADEMSNAEIGGGR